MKKDELLARLVELEFEEIMQLEKKDRKSLSKQELCDVVADFFGSADGFR